MKTYKSWLLVCILPDKCELNDPKIKRIIPKMRICTKLEELSLPNNSIADPGIDFIIPILPSFSILKCIDLNNNLITDIGAYKLIEVLYGCTSMEHIALCNKYNQLEINWVSSQ